MRAARQTWNIEKQFSGENVLTQISFLWNAEQKYKQIELFEGIVLIYYE